MSRHRLLPLAATNRRLLALLIGTALAGVAHADDPAAASSPQHATQLGEIKVTGKTTSPYRTTRSDTGALGDRPLLDTPYSVSVVDAALIRNQQAIDINEAFRNDPSVVPLSSGYSGESSGLAVRGLPVDLLNGFKMDGLSVPNWGSDLPLEPFSQIELLKGPGGFMYGFGAPGGILNFVSKQPTAQFYNSFTLGYLSNNVYSESADLGGTVDGWGYRVNLVHEDGDTFVHDGHIRRNAASLALTRDITPDLHWHFNGIWQDRSVQGTYYGIILGQSYGYPVHVDTPAPLDGSQRVSQPYTGYATTFHVANTGLKWDVAPDWTASVDFSYAGQTRKNHDSALIITDNQGNYTDLNYMGYSRYLYRQWQGMLQGKFQTGALEHQLVLGASWQSLRENYPLGVFASSQILGSGNIHDVPLFANPLTPISKRTYLAETTTQRALFASDTVTFSPQWSALLGLRYIDYVDKGFGAGSDIPTSRYDKTPLTPTAALIYKPVAPVSIYASYVQSLEQSSSAPQTAANAYQTFGPTKSKQYELGAKTDYANWTLNAALFRIERGLQYLNDDNVYVQDGRTRYQGLDLSGQFQWAQDWTVLAGVTWLDASNIRAGADVNGKRAYGAPRLSGNVYVEYAVPTLPGLVLDAGARYIGREAIEADNADFVGAYHTFDLGARYTSAWQGHQLTWRLGIDNLANEKYWLTSWGFILNQGTPRSVRASVTLTL